MIERGSRDTSPKENRTQEDTAGEPVHFSQEKEQKKKTLQSEPSELKLVNEEAVQGLTTFI